MLILLQQCLDSLREPYRSAVRLADLEGKSSQAIAEYLGIITGKAITPNHARVLVFRARLMLRECLGYDAEEAGV
jgi:DNA-directed RNA polymerase specialized sigma24 family protein